MVGHRGLGRFLDHRCARRAVEGGVGPREGQDGEEGEEALHGGRCLGEVGGDKGSAGRAR